MSVTRYDRAPIKATKTPEGFVQDSPILSRVGVFEYRQPDGTIRKEFRPPEEVFHADHLASIAGKPITDEHHGRITSANARGKLIGATMSPGRADAENPDNLRGDIVIHDATSLGTKRELSLGYTLDLDETPGEYKGVRYDAVQRNIRVNHLALVSRGRAGNARLNLDAADAVSVSTEDDDPIMTTIKLRLDSGQEIDSTPEAALAYSTLLASRVAEKSRADAAEATRDGLQAKVDAHEAALKQAREDGRKDAAGRLKLEGEAKQLLGDKFKADAKDADIRIAVIKHVRGDSVDLAGKSDAYVEAAYDLAHADGLKAAAAAAGNRQAMGAPSRQDASAPAKGSAAEARAGMIARMNKTTEGA